MIENMQENNSQQDLILRSNEETLYRMYMENGFTSLTFEQYKQ
jgi:hypothetical protein